MSALPTDLSMPLLHPEPWEIRRAPGPVVATAIHAGHDLRPELQPWLAVSEHERLREEDPFTDFFMTPADTTIRVNRSRFEVDLNRPRDLAIASDPDLTWGLRVWEGHPPEDKVAESFRLHDEFYESMTRVLSELVERWGAVLLIDIHSYNHRREGPDAEPADPRENPDIDLGVTTLDRDRFGGLLDTFVRQLRQPLANGRQLDVRENVKYPTGGHFPEWIYSIWGDKICTITAEYKKIFMDEWTSAVDLATAQHLRTGFSHAVSAARRELERCR